MRWNINFQNLDYRTPRYGAPGWVWWISLLVTGLLVILPILALLLVAAVLGGLVFLLLALVATVSEIVRKLSVSIRSLFTGLDSDGRRNVRPIRRDPS